MREIVRQLELRGLSGLIVVDFIDMSSQQCCREVEAEVEKEFRKYSAKVQVLPISSLGLMQVSKQRVRSSVLEVNTEECEVCSGRGRVISKESIVLRIARLLPLYAKFREVLVSTSNAAALYMLNEAKGMLVEAEQCYGFKVRVTVGDPGAEQFSIEGCEEKETVSHGELVPVQGSKVSRSRSWIKAWISKVLF